MVAGISAGCAFLISFIFGLLGKAFFLIALLRALIFAGLFFVLVVGIYYIYDKFLQPADTSNDDTDGLLGQNVDYSVGDDSDWAGNDTGIPDDILGLDYTLEDPADVPFKEFGSNEFGLHEGTAGPIKSPAAGLTDIGSSNAASSEFSDEAASKGLEQIDSNEYSKNGDLTQPEKVAAPIKAAAPEKALASRNEDYDVDMDVFVPYEPADYGDGEPARMFQSNHTVSEDSLLRGTVDMSLERKSGKKKLDFDGIDGKKVAGAIQTLLRKDEG
jgi:hypothetical protein